MRQVTKKLLKACSVHKDINVEKARKTADLKAISIMKYLHKTIDTVLEHEGYEIPLRLFFHNQEVMEQCERGENTLPVIIYIHGGGWVTDGVDNYERICNRIAQDTERIVISIDYRLAPEYKFPIGLEDCYAVTKAVCLDYLAYALNTSDITIMGDSAGGNLSTVVCQMARDRGEFACKRQILIYPVTYYDYSGQTPYESVRTKGEAYGLTAERMRDYISLYESCKEDRMNPYFTPLLSTDLTNMPRALIITAENDPLRDEGEDYGKQLKKANNEVQIYRIDDAVHGYFGVGINGTLVRKTMSYIVCFLKEK